LTINQNLTVLGTTTTLQSTTIEIVDAFTFNASGSSGSNVDGGLIVQSGSANGTGSAIFHDIGSHRWAVAKELASSANGNAAVDAKSHGGFVVTVKSLTLNGNIPHNGDYTTITGSEHSASYGVGEIIIDNGSSDDIWILGA
jgi:hypothetical protein